MHSEEFLFMMELYLEHSYEHNLIILNSHFLPPASEYNLIQHQCQTVSAGGLTCSSPPDGGLLSGRWIMTVTQTMMHVFYFFL